MANQTANDNPWRFVLWRQRIWNTIEGKETWRFIRRIANSIRNANRTKLPQDSTTMAYRTTKVHVNLIFFLHVWRVNLISYLQHQHQHINIQICSFWHIPYFIFHFSVEINFCFDHSKSNDTINIYENLNSFQIWSTTKLSKFEDSRFECSNSRRNSIWLSCRRMGYNIFLLIQLRIGSNSI